MIKLIIYFAKIAQINPVGFQSPADLQMKLSSIFLCHWSKAMHHGNVWFYTKRFRLYLYESSILNFQNLPNSILPI